MLDLKEKPVVKKPTTQETIEKLVELNLRKGITKGWLIAFICCLVLFMLTMIFAGISFVNTTNDMRETYIRNVEDVITSRANIQMTNDWERLPEEQRKSMLRTQFDTIVRYYTNSTPDDQRMNDEQIVNSFNQLWKATEKVPSINFFLPMAYMKVATNYNPVYNVQSKRGIAAFYLKTIEDTINLPLVRNDPIFRSQYNGNNTANDPVESMKILVARIDNLMATFRNREDWVILALFTNEYDVIAKYWNDGDGAIPDSFYKEGEVAETLKYYHLFKNWQIPMLKTIKKED